MLIAPLDPVRDSKGRWYAASFDRRQIVLFDTNGRFVRAFGRAGEGPGEIAAGGVIRLALGRADSLYVVQTGRVAVFDDAQRYGRTFRAPIGTITTAKVLPDGSLLLGAGLSGPDTFGLPYHVVGPDGVVARSFGDPVDHTLLDDPSTSRRVGVIPPAFELGGGGRSLWVAPRYRIRQQNVDGSAGAAFDVVESPWLPQTKDSVVSNRLGQPVRAQVGGGTVTLVGVEGDTVLWVSAARADPAAPGGSVNALEAVDARTGAVLASIRTPGFMKTAGDGFFRSSMIDGDGVWTHAVWRVRLRRR